jgi:DNA-binding MarR family transcriptional regulator
LEKLKDTIFYSLDKAIRTYRQFAQRNLRDQIDDITIDQWLILKTLHEHPEISQKELADQVFKDYGSITRIIDLLVQKAYLSRKPHPEDRRRFKLELTDQALDLLDPLIGIVKNNRQTALIGVSQQEIIALNKTLEKIIENCQLKSNTYESKNLIDR